jgi:phospholipid/cholesterol/gamma-HCH transport system ATP-binding protein
MDFDLLFRLRYFDCKRRNAFRLGEPTRPSLDRTQRERVRPGGSTLQNAAEAPEDSRASTQNDRFIEVRDANLTFGHRQVFKGLSCQFAKGEIHLLLGGSGTGKSTLLRMIGGLQRPDSGEVRVANQSLTNLRERDLGQIRKGIGMLFQNGALLDSMSVLENIGLPLSEHTKESPSAIRERVSEVLTSVGLDRVEALLPRQLSGGMLRRVAFARAIVMEPEILLCDEPFSGLDPLNVSRIEDLLVQLNRDLGLTIVVTSHHMASSLRMAKQMILLRDGGCIAGTPEELADSSDEGIVEFLGEDGRAYLARLHELRERGEA